MKSLMKAQIRKIKQYIGMGYVWILDNGHGAKNTYNSSPTLEDGRKFYEYEFNRAIVERLIDRLKQEGIEYKDLVPDYKDVGNFVMGRIARANRGVYHRRSIYLSIHSDAAPAALRDEHGWADDVHGSTVFYESSKGMKIAQMFAQNLASLFKDRGIKRRLNSQGTQYYAVLRETKMVALIIELGFYTNRVEVEKLLDDDFRDDIADKLFETIKRIEDERPI